MRKILYKQFIIMECVGFNSLKYFVVYDKDGFVGRFFNKSLYALKEELNLFHGGLDDFQTTLM